MIAEIYAGMTPYYQRNFIRSFVPDLAIQEIAFPVFDYLQIDRSEINSQSRKRQFVNARQIAIYFSCRKTKFPLRDIGKYFGGRDHSTVIYARDTVKDLIFSDKIFAKTIEEIAGLF